MVKRQSRLLFIVVLAAMLTGCATAGPSHPVSERQRSEIRTSILRHDWAKVERAYPNADPPRVRFVRTVPDHDRPTVLVRCLRLNGIHSTWVDNGLPYSPNVSPLDFARLSFTCSAQYPSESQVVSYLSSSQRKELFEYRRDTVRTCLLSIGMPSPRPPPRAAQPTEGIEPPSWHPYQVVWQRGLAPGPLSFLEQRCPPIPRWLDLAG
ncbi:MAG: hypothetical protein QOI70_1887 [Microbacteriaceae bacterium]|nr:hypothetical protein [Microbacteriaceae bacterium]